MIGVGRKVTQWHSLLWSKYIVAMMGEFGKIECSALAKQPSAEKKRKLNKMLLNEHISPKALMRYVLFKNEFYNFPV